MQKDDRSPYKNISIHISDRSHWNLTLNVYHCGNRSIGEERASKTDYYVFCFVKEGKGYVTENRVTHKVEAGQGFVAFPNVEVKIGSGCGERMNVTWVAFSGYLVEQYLLRAKLEPCKPIFRDDREGGIEDMFDALLAVSTEFPNRYCRVMAQLYSIFGLLLDNAIQGSGTDAAMSDVYLIKALDFIEANYREDISVEDIAASAGISRKTLYAVFKNLTGFSPKDYLISYRMSKASALLKDAGLTVETVAISVGYNDQFHFSKEFKKNVGMSPSAYRREALWGSFQEYQFPVDAVRQKYPRPRY